MAVRKKVVTKKVVAKNAATRNGRGKNVPAKSVATKGVATARRPRGAALEVHARVLLDRLLQQYPDAHCALDFTNAFELLCATILSAQCTDKRVNMVTPTLFARYPDASALAAAKPEALEEVIKSTGFFRSKTKSLIGMATALVERHDGEVPADMDALTALPGVGRKTANVVLGNVFDRNDGIVVDTHVTRLSNRLALTAETDAVRIEQALIPLFPRERWTMLSHLLIEHGRQVCDARKPRCGDCPLSDVCPSAQR
jgi:endonuclease-3